MIIIWRHSMAMIYFSKGFWVLHPWRDILVERGCQFEANYSSYTLCLSNHIPWKPCKSLASKCVLFGIRKFLLWISNRRMRLCFPESKNQFGILLFCLFWNGSFACNVGTCPVNSFFFEHGLSVSLPLQFCVFTNYWVRRCSSL